MGLVFVPAQLQFKEKTARYTKSFLQNTKDKKDFWLIVLFPPQ